MTNEAAVADHPLTTLRAIPRAAWPRRGDKVVYFVGRPDGAIKIGRTADMPQRMQHLNRENDAGIQVWATVPGNNLDEFIFHWRFADDRIGGEWFRPSPDLVEFIATLFTGGAA